MPARVRGLARRWRAAGHNVTEIGRDGGDVSGAEVVLLAVPSGQTMVMGGLITENKQNTSNGLPLISRVPVLGGLFGNQDLKNNRTELVLFITPQVLESEYDYQRVIEDLRRKMEQIEDVFPRPKPVPEPPATPENVSK